MTLPSSGPLSLTDIQAEFGGSNPISLSEYYAGGAYVPAGTSGTNGPVPSSGTISISNFYGTSNQYAAFDDTIANDFQFYPNSAYVQYSILDNGYVTSTGNSSQQWAFPTSAASNFEVYATLASGSVTSGTFNTWLSLGTSRDWTCLQTSVGTESAQISLQVRKIGTTTVLDTWTVDLDATVEI